MQKTLDYIKSLNLNLSPAQHDMLGGYVELVWQKKEDLNLTSVESKEEVWARHIADGLTLASVIIKEGKEDVSLADLGSGAGYIGLACAIALPRANVALVESLEKRCAFMRWVILKLGVKNARVINLRAGAGANDLYDFVTERAMGKLEDILPVCMNFVKEGGKFIAYQTHAQPALALGARAVTYALPADGKERNLMVFNKK